MVYENVKWLITHTVFAIYEVTFQFVMIKSIFSKITDNFVKIRAQSPDGRSISRKSCIYCKVLPWIPYRLAVLSSQYSNACNSRVLGTRRWANKNERYL